MRDRGRALLALLFALVATGATVGLSRVPYGSTVEDEAMIRLSWRTPGELVSECRRLTPEELERLPVHMRREEVCEGRVIPYHLRVTLDDRLVIDEVVHAAGAREDRPLYVYRELPVRPGEHRLAIVWEQERGDDDGNERDRDDEDERREGVDENDHREAPGSVARLDGDAGDDGDGDADDDADDDAHDDAHDKAEAERRTADRLTLEQTVDLRSGDVSLITYDPDSRVLVARGHGLTAPAALDTGRP